MVQSEALALRELPLAGQLPATLATQQSQQSDRKKNQDIEDVGKQQLIHFEIPPVPP
ncbi:MAG: hypothetical protein NTV55_11935 [Planctomycetota bacterium]|nr:hypothetical protein [Planctomycetota bacterium]